MDTRALKRFAQDARRKLREQVAAQLDRVIKHDSAELREKEPAIKELKSQIAASSREAVIERVAYVWFNRFCALRFMDVNQYTRMGTVSPAEGFSQPEILAEAKQAHIDESFKSFIPEQRVFDLLNGRITSKDPQQEAYRLLIVAVCNYYNSIMPFLFERIADYTELLMPEDLLSDCSILADTRSNLTLEVCKEVEVIGWLYQFYISEKKDEVFADLKKNKKISPENIPAATQLFTPRWIVRYLVENSLGRLWMLNRPESRLTERMAYYLKPKQESSDFLRVTKPEEIKICDPACGSGHMLVYAFDLLYAIYEEEGYETTEIPRLILENNLFGIEIDERAAELAGFALVMKAREKYRRFFSKPVQPNVCVLENINFEEGQLAPYLQAVGPNLFTDNLRKTLHQFRESNNFGSLIRPATSDVGTICAMLDEKSVGGNIFLHNVHERVLKCLQFAKYLSPRYHVVIANPPYMGNRSLNAQLQEFARLNYENSKSDLFAMFIERNLDLALPGGTVSMITMQSWMFLSSYEKIRQRILREGTILSMSHLGARAFDSIGGEVVSTTAFVLENAKRRDYKGRYLRLLDGKSEDEKDKALRRATNPTDCDWCYESSTEDFQKIPGNPIAYWVSDKLRNIFAQCQRISDIADTCAGLQTSDNARFLRLWFEVSWDKIGLAFPNRAAAKNSNLKWFPCTKGGSYRRWYGNNEYVVNWESDGAELFTFAGELYGSATRIIKNANRYFEEGLTWSSISSTFAMRYTPPGFIFETKGSMCFPHKSSDMKALLGLANSRVVEYVLGIFSPTLDFHEGPVGKVPVVFPQNQTRSSSISERAIEIAKNDWNSFEISWDFSSFPLLKAPFEKDLLLSERFTEVRSLWRRMSLELQTLEEENNELFIESYALQGDLSGSVPLSEISLNRNPQYRYGELKTEPELESMMLLDTAKEFISYAVGCMFGRYSIDKPGLILANQGATKKEYLEQIPDPSFSIDDDNVIPILDGDWFIDDVAERFRKFLRTVFGDMHYQHNLEFLENALGKDIRKYFLKDFYSDHVKRYKKRPIYWLFSSPKGTFNALIYMHRYRSDTVSVVLNDYLREFRSKLSARKSHLETVTVRADVDAVEKTRALKEIETLKKGIDELDTYEHEVLYPLATQKVEINLDDGVKVNYAKLGRALRAIPGMASEED
ncbi:BREX-1 system adenine-specific DNA-methyltransferase PglX [bacterium]|nr:BREX-1 system adenine-specific DNA-methyltransferase PglX [bacterium]QQR60301.1 MAG: BREX-1 system adenine-specific DNA-methyltransferase PglX [Candidatus Melainabacteria bacterium]